MDTKQQPEALRLTEIARYCFRSEGMSDPPEQFESPTGDMVDYFDHIEIEKELLARITELESQLAQRFDAADMATAAAQGFRDGVASVSAGWISVDERLPEPDGHVLAHNGKWTSVAAWMSGEYLEPLERWQDEHREFIEMMGPSITHWMPLPAAPGPADGESNV